MCAIDTMQSWQLAASDNTLTTVFISMPFGDEEKRWSVKHRL
jgi:hypothetical protein